MKLIVALILTVILVGCPDPNSPKPNPQEPQPTPTPIEEPQPEPTPEPEPTPAPNYVHHLTFDDQELGERCKPFGASKMVVGEFEGKKVCVNSIPKGHTGWGTWGGVLATPKLYKGQEVWLRARTYFLGGSDPFSYSEGNRLKFFRFRTYTADGSHLGYNDTYINNPTMATPYGFIYEGENKWQMFGKRPEHNVSFDRWETHEMYIRFDDLKESEGGNALVRVWKDGELLLETRERRTLKFPDAIARDFYLFTYWNGGSPKDQYMYIDDVKVAIEEPLNRDAHGNPFIGVD